MVVAEKQDRGVISDAEASRQVADAKSAAISELLQRRAAAAQTQAQTARARLEGLEKRELAGFIEPLER